MTFIEAAKKVLQEAGKPLHYREITKIALENGYITTRGKTPEATMIANFTLHIRKMGPSSEFKQVGKGIYALSQNDTKTTLIKLKCSFG